MASSMLKYGTFMFFFFSVVYTLAFYWYEAEGENIDVTGLEDPEGNPYPEQKQSGWVSGIVGSVADTVLEVFSWFSPFAIVKGLLLGLVPSFIYEPLNLLFLRPIGWIGTWITTEWVINKVRGSSES